MSESVQWRTFRESVYWPALAATLPWRQGFRLLDKLARRDDICSSATEDALAGARSLGRIEDEQDWKRRFRLTRLVDHTDMFLVRTRGLHWFERHVKVTGQFPSTGPYIAMTFHWGAGLWAIARMHAAGVPVHFVATRVQRESFHGDAVAYRYAVMRNRTVERAGGAPVIFTGGAAAAIESALSEGHVVVALYDVPAPMTTSTLATTVCGRSVELPAGMANIAMRTGVPVVGFDMGLDYQSGRRNLNIDAAFRPVSAQDFANRLGRAMTRLLTSDTAAWHFSGLAGHFFGESTRAESAMEVTAAASTSA
jgi:hypothetical protein